MQYLIKNWLYFLGLTSIPCNGLLHLLLKYCSFILFWWEWIFLFIQKNQFIYYQVWPISGTLSVQFPPIWCSTFKISLIFEIFIFQLFRFFLFSLNFYTSAVQKIKMIYGIMKMSRINAHEKRRTLKKSYLILFRSPWSQQ